MKKFLLAVLAVFIILPLLTFIPVGSFDKSDEVEIYLISNDIHVGIVLPAKEWQEFFPYHDSEWIEFGWGDRRFYFEMPTWEQFTFGLAADALFIPDPAVMHVEFLNYQPSGSETYIRKVKISKKTYAKIVEAVKKWFVLKNGNPILIPGRGYTSRDHFFEAHGSYSIIKTCNQWTSDVFADAGLRHPLWSPTKYGMEFIYEDN